MCPGCKFVIHIKLNKSLFFLSVFALSFLDTSAEYQVLYLGVNIAVLYLFNSPPYVII